MKTFGKTSLIASAILFVTVTTALVLIGEGSILVTVVAFWLIFSANIPIISIGHGRLKIVSGYTLYKKIDVPLSDISSINVEAKHNMCFVLHMKDGTVRNITTGNYSIDTQPLYNALKETGITITSTGYGTLDWAK